MKIAISFLLLLLIVTPLCGQSFYVSLFDTSSGLPNGRINDVYEDRDGFVWVAYADGLYRYDGKNFAKIATGNFRRFFSAWNELFSLRENEIIQVPALKSLITVDAKSDQITVKPAATKNCFWILTDTGLYYRSLTSSQKIELAGFSGPLRECKFSDGNGEYSLMTPSGVIYKLDESRKELQGFVTRKSLSGLTKYLSLNDSLFFVADNAGIYRWQFPRNSGRGSWTTISDDFVATDLLVTDAGAVIISTRDGIWLGNDENGEYRFSRIINGNEPHRPDALPFSDVSKLCDSGNNNIWAITSKGIGLLQQRGFQRISFDIPMASFEQAAIASQGVIYLGENGLFRCIKSSNINSQYNCNTIDFHLGNEIQTAIAAKENRLWVATSTSKVFYLENGKRSATADLSYRGKNIFNLFIDRDGNLWVGQAPGEKPIIGILKITPDLKVVNYDQNSGFENRMLSTRQAPNGKIYCAGIGSTTYLYEFDPASNTFNNISAEMKFDHGENFEVHSFDIASDSTIWLGSTAGLLRYKNGEIEKISFDELVDSEVIAIAAAKDGAVWFSTDNRGVVRYDHTGKRYAIFDKHAGLATNFLTYRAIFQTKDGTICVGTREGFFLSSPIAHQWRKTTAPLFSKISSDAGSDSTRYYSYNSTIDLDFASLTYPARTLQYKYRLSHAGDGEWKSLPEGHLQLPNLEAGNYKLEIIARQIGGYTWSDPLVYSFNVARIWYEHTYAIASFILLGLLAIVAVTQIYNRRLQKEKRILEGKVVLRTMEISKQSEEIAAQRDHLLSQKELIERQNFLLTHAKEELEQKIHERTAELSLSNKELMEHNVQLEQFAFMTAHNLRGPVARLLGLSAIFNEGDAADPMNAQVIARINQSAHDLDETIRDMASILNIKKGIQNTLTSINAYQIFSKALQSLEPEFRTREIQVTNRINEKAEVMAIEPYIYSVFYNALTNSIKYADVRKKPEIIAESVEMNGQVQITISDNGIGFDATVHRNKLFKPYSRLNSSVEGKGLGLYLMKIEMESMRGSVDIQSKLHEGTVLKLEFKKYAPRTPL